MRRRIGLIRRTLAPHRVAFAALARPDMALHEELGEPWPGLTDRLDRALDAVENLRDLLLGTFEIYMGRTAQDANDTMKVLTLLSAVLLPGVVLAGVMGMNFKLSFFDARGELLDRDRRDGRLRSGHPRRRALARLALSVADRLAQATSRRSTGHGGARPRGPGSGQQPGRLVSFGCRRRHGRARGLNGTSQLVIPAITGI